MERFGYFMVRLHYVDVIARVSPDPTGEGQPLSGLVERLSTGEKRVFASGAELLRLLRSWPPMGAGTDPRGPPPDR